MVTKVNVVKITVISIYMIFGMHGIPIKKAFAERRETKC